MSASIDMEIALVELGTPTGPAFKLNNKTRHSIMTELKKNMTRNVRIPKSLSQEKIKANLAKLKGHYAATKGGDGAEQLAEIMDDMHPTVQGVYQLMQDQTKTIVAAIDARADRIDQHLDGQSETLERLVHCVAMQTRVLRGVNYEEDSKTDMTNLELLAHNCQAVRALQSQNLNLRADLKACPGATIEEQRRKRLFTNEAANEFDRKKRQLAQDAKKTASDAKTAANKKTREDAKVKTDAEKKAVREAEKAKKDLEKEAEKAKKDLENANNPNPKRKRNNIREVKGKPSIGVEAAGEEAKAAEKPPPKRRRSTKKTGQLITCKPDTTAENIHIFFAKPGEQSGEQPGENEVDGFVPFATEVNDEAKSEEGLDLN